MKQQISLIDCKGILIESIELYKAANKEKRKEMEVHINNQLKKHSIATKVIGKGFDMDFVNAALIFKRIFKF